MGKIYEIKTQNVEDKLMNTFALDVELSNTSDPVDTYIYTLNVFREIFKTIDFAKILRHG